MPTHLRALVVILVLAAVTFWVAKAPACALAMNERDFVRRRNLWFAIVLVAFLAHNFWIYVAAAAVLLVWAAATEANRLALYYFVLFAVPAIDDEIPGFGLIRYLFAIDYYRLLALAVLLPAAVALHKSTETERFGRLLADKLLLGYVGLIFVLMLNANTLTNTLRHAVFYAFVDILLPYYVASRSVRTIARFRDVSMSFAVAAMVLSVIAAFEVSRHWLLYAALDDALGVYWPWGHYLERTAGVLRAQASLGQPIPLGYAVAVAMGLYLYASRCVASVALRWLGWAVLAAGLIAALSRGPWIGAAAMLAVFLATGRAVWNLARLSLLALIGAPLLLLSPVGEKILDYLPFVGTVDEQNVVYRRRLLEIGIQVVLQNPLFGASNVIMSPEMQELRQGQGIIDIVNSYIGVALSSGLVGLSLFAGVFAAAMIATWSGLRYAAAAGQQEPHLLGRALFAAMTGILVTIATVSSVLAVPLVYWTLAGLCVGYARMLRVAAAMQSAERDSRTLPARA